MPDTAQLTNNPEIRERRFHPRKQVQFHYIKLGDSNDGIILNISERGLALHVAQSLTGNHLPSMRFRLSRSDAWLCTPGRIAWVSWSKKTAGVEFLDISYEARVRVKKWISALIKSSAPI
jgi:PilZ domain